WEDITPTSLPEWSLIHKIELSIHDRGTAYLAATRYKLDDYQPYLYKTVDYGETWMTVSDNLPDGEITRVIREDPIRKHLLYVGTETGVFVSFDDGESWGRLQSNLPIVPVYDMVVKDNELVLATHGRSFWILDDLAPLRQLTAEVMRSSVHLFEPPATYRRYLQWSARGFTGKTGKNYIVGLGAAATFLEDKLAQGGRNRRYIDAGEGPPNGVVIHYLLEEAATDEITLTILDSQGEEISTFTSAKKKCGDTKEDEDTDTEPLDSGAKRLLSTDHGLNRFVWDMRFPDAIEVTENHSEEPEDPLDKEGAGPLAPPGVYRAQLKVGDQTYSQSFELLKDPRVSATQEDFDAQFKLWCDIRDKISEAHEGVNLLRRIRGQVEGWKCRAKEGDSARFTEISEAADALLEGLKAIETELIQTDPEAETGRLRMPIRLDAKLADLTSVVSCVDAAPPKQAFDVFEHLSSMVDEQLSRLQLLVESDVSEFNTLIGSANLPAVGG
ncbi:MAG: glycosyl hydrolase, partial [Candidatus Poribacteria bacterium]|nr:glycosyl hydrolase [Candidatus Poribacteria bacterium]